LEEAHDGIFTRLPRKCTPRTRLARSGPSEGSILSNGRWQHDDRAEFYDGDWIYLGDGVWEDAYLASLPADTRRDLMDNYTAVLAESEISQFDG